MEISESLSKSLNSVEMGLMSTRFTVHVSTTDTEVAVARGIK